ncbi:hypothetical protein ES707_04595 [subsurface metagenome]
MQTNKVSYLIFLLILLIIIVFYTFSCSPASSTDQLIEESAQETIEEISIGKPVEELTEEEVAQEFKEPEIIENVAEEEVIEEEMIEEDDNNGNTEIEYEIIYTLNLRYDDGITYYVLINPIDLSDDTFKDNIKKIIRKIVEEKGKKISIEIFDKRDSLENGYEYDAEDPGEWLEYNAKELEEWKAWITNEEILNDLAVHSIASYDGELETGLYLNTLYFFTYSESDNTENPEIDKYVDIIQFNP